MVETQKRCERINCVHYGDGCQGLMDEGDCLQYESTQTWVTRFFKIKMEEHQMRLSEIMGDPTSAMEFDVEKMNHINDFMRLLIKLITFLVTLGLILLEF